MVDFVSGDSDLGKRTEANHELSLVLNDAVNADRMRNPENPAAAIEKMIKANESQMAAIGATLSSIIKRIPQGFEKTFLDGLIEDDNHPAHIQAANALRGAMC